jgi:hypothetical protein
MSPEKHFVWFKHTSLNQTQKYCYEFHSKMFANVVTQPAPLLPFDPSHPDNLRAQRKPSSPRVR